MEATIKQWLRASLETLSLTSSNDVPIEVSRPKSPEHGDYTSNIALALAKQTQRPARELAQQIIDAQPLPDTLLKAEVAGAGFINVYLQDAVRGDIIHQICEQKDGYGHQAANSKGRALVEFVSANPTGPLHVGHGRGAAYGASLVNLLKAAGYQTDSEYYVNDKGRQMDILALSVWLRYLELCGEELAFPQGCYQGDYIQDIAAQVHRENQESFRHAVNVVYADLPSSDDTEPYLDALVVRMRSLLGDGCATVFNIALDAILERIGNDLRQFGVKYDAWFSERREITDEKIAQTIALLKGKDMVYEKDGAQWFRSTTHGDEKDRVVVRANGQTTYFASDIAYHLNKYERGYDLIVNVWGADHHGYVPRLNAAVSALGFDSDKLHTILVQFVNLFRDGALVAMSTRSGEFQPLSALVKEVGCDAGRLFYLMCRHNQHLDFDMSLAKSSSKDNPVYYIQYAHARVRSMFAKLDELQMPFAIDKMDLELLKGDEESHLLKQLSQYPGVLENAAAEREPHIVLAYLRTLSKTFHAYYNNHKVLVDDEVLRNTRLALAQVTGYVIKNGLNILGASAPDERM